MASKKILLIEPGYKNKYPPLGLMKIAQYHGPRGKRDHVRFIKGRTARSWTRPGTGSTSRRCSRSSIRRSPDDRFRARRSLTVRPTRSSSAGSQPRSCTSVSCGATLAGHPVHQRAAAGPPAVALHLDEFSEELYADDIQGRPIEDLVPDYSILDQIDYKYPVRDAYFAYTSRGCIRKCHFCGVPKLEGAQRDTDSLTAFVKAIDELYGPKKDLILMDNNVVASPAIQGDHRGDP